MIREFYSLDRNKPTIGLLMMLKNEKKRLHVTLESLIDSDSGVKYVDAIIVYDTGSTDNTKEIVKDFCEKHKINLYMKEGEFVNFSVSRNVSLDFADTIDVKYLLLMDCNDEIRDGFELRKIAEINMNSIHTAFLVKQHWKSKDYDSYYNVRFVKARTGWRYKGSVHEYMSNSDDHQQKHPVGKIMGKFLLFQDRTQDDDKTGKRFKRDKILLLSDYKSDPVEPRTLFYLAQTCSCLGQEEEAFYYYKLRTTLEGFQEEKFHAYLRCGNISIGLQHDWYESFAWFMKAFEHTPRVEPLLRIVSHYMNKKNWLLAFHFCKMACDLPFPKDLILFVDYHSYIHQRWHLMGIIGYYANQFDTGKEACKKAIESDVLPDCDRKNLQFYLDRELELAKKN